MKKIMLLLLCVAFCRPVVAQDPTVPSAAILNRLKPDQVAAVQAPAVVPLVKLKAIVMADEDHGSGVIEVDGRRLILRLDRHGIMHSVQLGGVEYAITSFTPRSITLESVGKKIIAQ